ncbi:MAG: DOMON-like domain-containing protein [Methylotetracoccus sp.]|nr:DOMON-like domain-containing protein [Methylotetracoccus sp.]
MTAVALTCHPATPCNGIDRFDVGIHWITATELSLHYTIDGDVNRLRLPNPGPARRSDRLWESTCLEVFLRAPGSNDYCEFNFAPSAAWAAYVFKAYRDGMMPMAADHPPQLTVRSTRSRFELDALLSGFTESLRIGECGRLSVGIAAVIEEQGGARSYWALRHPSAHPDFHHPESFVLTLGFGESPSVSDLGSHH